MISYVDNDPYNMIYDTHISVITLTAFSLICRLNSFNKPYIIEE